MFKQGKNIDLSIGNNLSIHLIWCPAGSFDMSFTSAKTAYQPFKSQVEFTKGFWVSDTLLTEQIWLHIFDEYHNKYLPQSNTSLDYPLSMLSYTDVNRLLSQLRILLKPMFDHNLFVGLPNFIEWEYFARADEENGYCFGKDKAKLNEYAWYRENNDDFGLRQVKTKKPNPWNIYDLFGNIPEYCYDVDCKLNASHPLTDPQSLTEVDTRLPVKGGNYDSQFEDFLTDKIIYSGVNNGFNDEIGMRLLIKHI